MYTKFSTLVEAVRTHAATNASDVAYVTLNEKGAEVGSITYGDLHRRASQMADALSEGAAPGDRALLVYPPGLEFMVGFFACQYAGIIAVPTILPRHGRLRDSSAKIVEDCEPKLGLTTGEALESVQHAYREAPAAARMSFVATDKLPFDPAATPRERAVLEPRTLGLLQYTSGSTSLPKGVMVSHGNLAANTEMITVADHLYRGSTRVGWIPLYHDMGLIFNALQAAYVGAKCVLMAPLAFVAHPLLWPKAIHKYQAEMGIAPNFAYDLCLEHYHPERMEGVDLSCWRLALNGAEPVRAHTIEQFARTFSAHGLRLSAPHPTYGMAEATLMISGGLHGGKPRLWSVSRRSMQEDHHAVDAAPGERAQVLVGCGKSLLNERIAIVDPESMEQLAAGHIGEIWVHGPLVAQGYWNRPDATEEIFRGQIKGGDGSFWLRTGDLGCLDDTGELYITGRIKDIIIVRGSNYYPQDIEMTAEKSHRALRRGYAAAFVVPHDGEGEDDGKELLVVACEVRQDQLATADPEDIMGAVRQAVVREHELMVHRVILALPNAIPKTTSGKIRRRATCEKWQTGELALFPPAQPARPESPPQ